jgi:hypothetical protein
VNARQKRPDSASVQPERHCTGEVIMPADKDSEIGALAAIGPFGAPPPTKYERLLARAKEVPAARTIVVHPCDETSLRGPIEAAEAGLIVPILVGPAVRIQAVGS